MTIITRLHDATRRSFFSLRRSIRRYPALHGPLRHIARASMRIGPIGALINVVSGEASRMPYARWVAANDTLTEADRAAIRAHIERFARRPLISVVMPAYDTEERFLREAIASVRAQLYPHWELCVADDASPAPHVWRVLQDEATRDSRIRITRRERNGHISAATNTALELATGEFVALLDHDDVLPEHALYEVAAEIDAHPDADLIYTDEDKIDGDGRRFDPYFKTDWNPELLLGHNMVSHLGVYRRSVLERIGGLRAGFEGSQDYDLALRAVAATTPERIRHIPAIVYHWRQRAGPESFSESGMQHCVDAARRAIAEYLAQTGATGARVEARTDLPMWSRVRRPVPDPAPLVSVIVPTRDRAALLARCVEGVLHRTDYAAVELLIVDNGSTKPAALALLERLSAEPRVRVLREPGPFNFSALNNRAAAQARGEILLLLNNDIEVIEGDWLREMVSHAVRPEVGAVGARLLYGNGRVQHASVVLGVGGTPPVAAHLHRNALRHDPGYLGHLFLTRNVSAVTGACLALRRSVYEEVGGLDAENLPVAFNDVDLCLKIRKRGYWIVWTPFAELYHLESASRGSDLAPEERERFSAEVAWIRSRWGEVLDNDPFYGPHFDHMHGDYRLAALSRRVRPWLRDARDTQSL